MRQVRPRALVLGAGLAIAIAAGSATAYASISAGPIDHSGVIHACYTTRATHGSHAVVLQNAGTSCASGRKAIKWNQKGPAGPQGPQGNQGIQGPPGPPGVVTGYAAYGGTVSLPNTFTTVDTLNLPPGDFLLTAKVVVFNESLTGDDNIPCALLDGSGAGVDISFTKLTPGSFGADQDTLALTGATIAGGTIQLECFAGQATATATDSVITAVPVMSVTGATSHLHHLPHLRSGAVALQRG